MLYARFKGLLLAAGIIPPNAPLAKRLEILSSHISPKPGSNIEIDKSLLNGEAITTKNPGKLFGWIKVSPPKGQCFIVTTNPERADQMVCKPTNLKWLLEEIDKEKGTVSWIVKTSEEDFGTPISWQTPYVVAKVLPPSAEFHKENSTPIFFKSCIASLGRTDGSPRKITLTTFNNKPWIVKFPEEDAVIAPPKKDETPPPETKKENSGHGGGHEEKQEESGHGGGHEEKKADDGHGGGHGEAPPPPKTEEKKEEPEAWTINTGRGFEMNVGNFITAGSMPPGKQGTCRYVYDYPPGNFSRGRIECHHTDQYLYVYMIVPCMKPIMPEIKNSDQKR
jgi:hypothetical protein